MDDGGGARELFQSPSLRGAARGSAILIAWIFGAFDFSPLLFGVPRAAFRLAIPCRVAFKISVPYSSGCRARRGGNSYTGRATRNFQSPSLQGAARGRASEFARVSGRCKFQSPSPGCRARLGSGFGSVAMVAISVPALFGVPRALGPVTPRLPAEHFSPLLIGEPRAVTTGACGGAWAEFQSLLFGVPRAAGIAIWATTRSSPFQSPSLRGARAQQRFEYSSRSFLFQSLLFRCRARPSSVRLAICSSQSFQSPSLRGAARAPRWYTTSDTPGEFRSLPGGAARTREAEGNGFCRALISVPFSSGCRARLANAPGSRQGTGISIPFSSGCRARRRVGICRCWRRSSFQSPSLRGAARGGWPKNESLDLGRGDFSPSLRGAARGGSPTVS